MSNDEKQHCIDEALDTVQDFISESFGEQVAIVIMVSTDGDEDAYVVSNLTAEGVGIMVKSFNNHLVANDG